MAVPTVAPRRVIVAVPARDEERSIEACLASIDAAAARCPVPVHVVVGADRCRDATADVARTFAGAHGRVTVVTGRWGTVGAARAAAVAVGIGERADGWIANTDADCVVPDDWLTRQLDLAARGPHAVAGRVRLDDTAPVALANRFRASYAGGRHVHAANLGVRVEAYLLAGGWSSRSVVGEEHHLWRRLRQLRLAAVHDLGLCVVTSHRTHGRVAGGFATHLRRLAAAAEVDA